MLGLHGNEVETYGLSGARIMVLVKECLSCNVFKWSGRYFSQIRGLAMGQRRQPLLYCRYIDNCCVITSTQSEMDECSRTLNQQSQYIKLTRETPRRWLPFLNTQLKLTDGIIHVKWYRKESSKNIIIHARSAHPTTMKRAVIRNMFRRATRFCPGEAEPHESTNLTVCIVRENGYTSREHQNRRTTNEGRNHACGKNFLCAFPSSLTMRAQLQDDVVLVNIPKDNIRKQLVRNRLYGKTCQTEQCVICPHEKSGDCTKTGVVYQIECLCCHAIYIGETGRPLRVRVNEHLAAERRESLILPLGRHRRDDHNGNDFAIRFTILAHESEFSARKTLGTFWISVRNPRMNNRNEHLSITSELKPFIPLCEI
ncbi:hypothetical protein Y032_0100g3303 [Ancylostoma ceylanicum]|uniref:Helix-turn-helix domain-containing protein n=1 Tax=Ancylostoma ceylanicum TaxID=53326 RepID=A0A016THI2_9BILA|nr:hypothetical protein Y032_0100g3303 [Ancylostoma ceylanicum]